METKLNPQALEAYAQSFLERLSPPFFQFRDRISGDQILEFTPIRQVNLFVLKTLFARWKEEAERLRSPFFDYQHPEVQQALNDFMDQLSQHISVAQGDFEPLLRQSIIDALRLGLTPLDYFKDEVTQQNVRFVHADSLKQLRRYIDYNRVVLQEVISELESGYTKQAPAGEIKLYFHKAGIRHDRQLTSMQQVLSEFSAVLPLREDDIVITSEVREAVRPGGRREPAAPSFASHQPNPQLKPLSADVGLATEPDQAPDKVPLNARFVREPQPTLNDRLRKEAPARTLLDEHQQKKVDNIRNAIPLNQRYAFINELFKGDNVKWSMALQELEGSQSYDEALSMLDQKWALEYGWQNDNEHVMALREIVRRKFA
ncbi:hypothetical protein SAMN05421823_103474 [Catalinimonas alkaloidigena]|uniref:Uncharacterized protein n=1 Tax=Catalinimonas alkaloidigena TaxID=1075417 RepID=A0A1G9EHF5_9BACT|nr:hypothetical protein [Catalinimonas alkaloidigena]SDK75556.1 hypothetical protein SAMN05421823_103474 [Catalinimonas alkaloidigena]